MATSEEIHRIRAIIDHLLFKYYSDFNSEPCEAVEHEFMFTRGLLELYNLIEKEKK